MGEHELLGDRTSHRGADDVRALEPELAHERHGVGCEIRDRERSVRRRRPANAPVVEGRDAEAVLQARDLVDPAGALVGEPGDEQDVVARAALVDPEADAVRGDDLQRAYRTISTSQCACWATFVETEPWTMRLAKCLPCVPTTMSAAS